MVDGPFRLACVANSQLISSGQVKDVLFEPVRKTQDAMFFVKTPNGMWVPCGPKQAGTVQTTMQELAAQGLAEKVLQMVNACVLYFETVYYLIDSIRSF